MRLFVRSFLAVGLMSSNMLTASMIWAQEEAKPVETESAPQEVKTEEAPKEPTAEDYLKLAEKEMSKQLPKELSEEEKTAFIKGVIEESLKFNEEGLKLNPEGAVRMRLLSQRFVLLRVGAVREYDGFKEKAEAFLAEVSKDSDQNIAKMGANWTTAYKYSMAGNMTPEERTKFFDEVKAELMASEVNAELTSKVMNYARTVENYGTAEQATAVYSEFAELFSKSEDEKIKKFVDSLIAAGRRASLPGHPMELIGKKLDGTDFVISDLKGKVVLVDFWATWCGPCIAEFPNMKEMYAKYRDHGFEIVGISLDKDAEKVKAFVETSEVPWMILHHPENERGWDHPAAVYYGINAIPAMVLIGADGNVISTKARGEELRELLSKTFPDVKDTAPAADATASE